MQTETLDVAPAEPIVLAAQPANIVELARRRNELLAIELPDEIFSPQEYQAVADHQGVLQRETKEIGAPFDEGCNGGYKAWKMLCAVRDAFIKPLQEKNERARGLLSTYQQTQDRIRRDEERRIRDEEQKRLEEQRKAEAKRLEKAGDKAAATVVRNTPVQAAAVSLPTVTPQVAGLSYRDEWDMVPVLGDTPAGWAKAMAVNVKPEFLQFVAPNKSAMKAFARNTKGSVKVPGFTFVCTKVPVRR